MRGRAGHAAATLVVVVIVAAGCAGKRIVDGVFHSASGYRVGLPGPAWTVSDGGPADLELRHRSVPAGMLVNASCDGPAARRDLDVLARHVLIGLRDRQVLAEEPVSLNGRAGGRTLVEGRPANGQTRVRVEAYVLRDARCVYDLLYMAPPEAFGALHPDFLKLVQSFRTR